LRRTRDTPPAGSAVRILTVCTHNRTRSVMMAAMLGSVLEARSGHGAVVVRSAGFGLGDLPPIDAAVDAMARRGLDVSGHRSRTVTAALADGADVILTAEREHVVKIAALAPSAFARAMTLPEFLDLARPSLGAARPEHGGDMRAWVESLTAGRTAPGYLSDRVAEVLDPTGSPRRAFEAAVAVLEQQCTRAADLLIPPSPR
jgi:protein-tyrosine phosphatase